MLAPMSLSMAIVTRIKMIFNLPVMYLAQKLDHDEPQTQAKVNRCA